MSLSFNPITQQTSIIASAHLTNWYQSHMKQMASGMHPFQVPQLKKKKKTITTIVVSRWGFTWFARCTVDCRERLQRTTRWNHFILKSKRFFERYEEKGQESSHHHISNNRWRPSRRFQVQPSLRKFGIHYKIHTRELIRYKKFIFKLLEVNVKVRFFF